MQGPGRAGARQRGVEEIGQSERTGTQHRTATVRERTPAKLHMSACLRARFRAGPAGGLPRTSHAPRIKRSSGRTPLGRRPASARNSSGAAAGDEAGERNMSACLRARFRAGPASGLPRTSHAPGSSGRAVERLSGAGRRRQGISGRLLATKPANGFGAPPMARAAAHGLDGEEPCATRRAARVESMALSRQLD